MNCSTSAQHREKALNIALDPLVTEEALERLTKSRNEFTGAPCYEELERSHCFQN